MYKPEYFKAHELIPPDSYTRYGERGFFLIDDRLLRLCDALREEFGSATINNYKYGKDRKWSGLRTSDSPYYSKHSQHTFGRAADIIFSQVTAEDVREQMKTYPNQWLLAAGVKSLTLEDDVSWLHVDVRNGDLGINSFKP